ncbi:putative histone-fold protein [Helianthus annuus]|nr:putative histone-fold protein [Helianthus annuus]KAJ0621184.1 putative histone-fold protein [Helianthus annuus]KAJ0625719.1 putative histone-fold protein [Helianthus annuus]KAJ0807279.1 putative histone-fold protein [Helianthus annuus]
MTKIIKEMLPPGVRVARDTQDLLIDCCSSSIWFRQSQMKCVAKKIVKQLHQSMYSRHRNLQTPKSKFMWKPEIMRPWSAARSWKSDFDVPILPENMMDLIPEKSSYRAEYLRMLSKQAETKEGFEKVSPMEHDAEESSTPRKSNRMNLILIQLIKMCI